jgi:hypothetical protein
MFLGAENFANFLDFFWPGQGQVQQQILRFAKDDN